MQMIWPSTIVPALASTHRHVTGHKPYLLPTDQRGLFLSTMIDPTHLTRSVQRRVLTAWGRTLDLDVRLDTTFFTRSSIDWDPETTVRLSSSFLDVLLPRLRGSRPTEFTVEADSKDDPKALQVIRVDRHDGSPVLELAALGFITRVDDATPTLPRDPRELDDLRPLTRDEAETIIGTGPDHLRRFAYRDAAFATATDTRGRRVLTARWTRGTVTTIAATPLPSTQSSSVADGA